jgi:hypothetical protein
MASPIRHLARHPIDTVQEKHDRRKQLAVERHVFLAELPSSA